MRAVIQRVSSADVRVAERTVGRIGRGLVVLLGIADGDEPSDRDWLAAKILALRIFEDPSGKMNCSLAETGGEILVISQFTLLASTAKGTRPSFHAAARPEAAIPLYESFVAQMSAALGRPAATGEFGARMAVSLVNDGPVTLVLDSRLRD